MLDVHFFKMVTLTIIVMVSILPDYIYSNTKFAGLDKTRQQNMESILSTKPKHWHAPFIVSRRKRDVVSFVGEKDGKFLQQNGHEAFRDVIITNPGMFLQPDVNISFPFSDLTKKIFDFSVTNWENQKDKLAGDLYNPYYADAWKINLCSSRAVLFESMIQLCPAGTFFGRMNEMLRNYNTKRYLNLQSFALMLNVILFEWPEVTQYAQTTYRGFTSSVHDYQIGMTFAWIDFATATTNETMACRYAKTALFVIDNSENSNYKPRSIAKFFPNGAEYEFLYPVAVLFHVDQIRRGACGDITIPTIYISLEAGDHILSRSRICIPSRVVIFLCTVLIELAARIP